MKLVLLVAGMLADVAPGAQRRPNIAVYVLDNAGVPYLVRYQAQGMATQMFAHAGVIIEWTIHRSPSNRSIFIELATKTPDTFQHGALAYARPFDDAHVVVLYDRVQGVVAPSRAQHVLAHVLVHEITHILEGSDWHSASGVMKAHWAGDDYAHMQRKPLDFTDADIILLRSGLKAWLAGTAKEHEAHSKRGIYAEID